MSVLTIPTNCNCSFKPQKYNSLQRLIVFFNFIIYFCYNFSAYDPVRLNTTYSILLDTTYILYHLLSICSRLVVVTT